MKPEAYLAIIESPALQDRIKNTPETLAFVPEAEKPPTIAMNETAVTSVFSRTEPTEKSDQTDPEKETRVQKMMRRIYGKEISLAEKIATGVVLATAIAIIVFTAIPAWKALVVAYPFILSLITKKVLGISIMGFIGSKIKSFALKQAEKVLGDLYKKSKEEREREREAREEAKRRKKSGEPVPVIA